MTVFRLISTTTTSTLQYYFRYNLFSPIKTPFLLFFFTEKVVVETLLFSTNQNNTAGKIKITFDQIGIQSEIWIYKHR
jgi:hypothetical protein